MTHLQKQLMGWLISVLIIILTLEVLPFVAGKFFLGVPYSRREVKDQIRRSEISPADLPQDTGNVNTEEYLGEHLLHPYLGYVSVPRSDYNRFGFPGIDPILKKSDSTLNVCLTGGSVAKQLVQFAGSRIIQNLENLPAFAGKKVKLAVISLGGFKQPQQLMAINYFLALGAEFDIVINLDGFNEIVLPASDNLPFKVFPSYPRHWNMYSRKRLDQRVILQLGRQASLQERRDNSKARMNHSMFRHSNFALFLWKITDRQREYQQQQAEEQLRLILASRESDYQSTGPSYNLSDTSRFLASQAEFWARSSRQIADLGKNGRFTYYHFLQPNQYDIGSKTLTQEEMEIAFESGPFSYKTFAGEGYPMLRKQGEILIQQGVRFIDLSGLFREEKRTIYSDKCCHLNQLGYELMADRITSAISR